MKKTDKPVKVQGRMRVLAAHARAVADSQAVKAESRIVIAVIGEDRPGIMAGVTGVLAKVDANILDVSQTIMSDLFTMVMLVDIKRISVPFSKLKATLEAYGRSSGLSIISQHEEIFQAMHRV
jgi:ACT domain-containing protein